VLELALEDPGISAEVARRTAFPRHATLTVARTDPNDRNPVDEWGHQSFPASDPPQNW
jgi:hypothetical protein